MNNNFISSKAIIDPSTFIGNNVNIFGEVRIGPDCFIDDNVVLGYPSRQSLLEMTKRGNVPGELAELDAESQGVTIIGSNCCIKYGSIISIGSEINDSIYCDVWTHVGARCKIGRDSQLLYGARIYNDVSIGLECRVGGFCCDRSVIEDSVSMFGDLVHSYRKPLGGLIEPSPIIRCGATVGWNAIIIGGIEIGTNTYVAAGAIVTKNIPPNSVVVGNASRFEQRSKWKGALSKEVIRE